MKWINYSEDILNGNAVELNKVYGTYKMTNWDDEMGICFVLAETNLQVLLVVSENNVLELNNGKPILR